MNKKLICTVVSVLACLTSVALGQTQQLSRQSKDLYTPHLMGSYIPALPPAQRAAIARRGYLARAAAVALDAGQYDIAEEDARQAMSHGVGAGISEEVLASALAAQGKTQEALQAYKVMADQGNVFPRNLLPYALLLLKTGRWSQAVEAYNKQLPYLADGDLMVANSHFSPYVLQPGQLAMAIHIALGLTYGGSASWGRHSQDDKALMEFQKALALSPASSLAHLYYARKLQHLGRRAEAQAAFKKAAELGEGDVRAAAEQASK